MADKYADRIANDLLNHLSKEESFAIKEFYYKGFRSDVLSIEDDFIYVDYEIKTNVADFYNDFSKVNKYGNKKHAMFNNGELTHKLFFVTPPNLIPLSKIPEQYGVLYYTGDNLFDRVRQPNNVKLTEEMDDIFNNIVEYATKNRFVNILNELYEYRINNLLGEIGYFDYSNHCKQIEIFELNDTIKKLEDRLNKYGQFFGKVF